MVHLSKSQGKFHIVVLAMNYNVLAASQVAGITSRKGAFKNIRSLMRTFGIGLLMVQDNTGEKPVMLQVTNTSITITNTLPKKPYVVAATPVVIPAPATAAQPSKPVQQVSRPVKKPVVMAPKKPVPVVKLVPKKPVVAKKPAPRAKLKK
jgi:hypothetical protein